MIIQALYQRYLDLSNDPESGVSQLFFSVGKLSYVLELEQDGTLVNVVDIREIIGKKLVPRRMIFPEQPARANGVNPYFLSDKAEYLIGHYSPQANEQDTLKKISDAKNKYDASRKLAQQVLCNVDTPTARAILLFYNQWDPGKIRDHPLLQSILADLDKGIDTNMGFQLRHTLSFAHQEDDIKLAWIQYRQQQEVVSEYDAQCLITGVNHVSIARTHDKIKGVRNAQQAGASLVSFNFRSAESYGKDGMQSYNSPVSKIASFAYTTALNHLLASRRNRLLVGDMTVVFWSGQATIANEIEPFFTEFLDQGNINESEDRGLTAQLKDILDRVRNGLHLEQHMIPHADTPFYVLGLSPNNARVAVRFFWMGHFGNMVQMLSLHASDLSLIGQYEDSQPTPSIYRILEESKRVGSDGKKVGDGAPDRVGGELFRSVIEGVAYPYTLYTSILNRVRADGIVNRLRASIIKAYLSRYSRTQHNEIIKEVLTMSLNTETTEPAYRLGRLFSVLERAQQDAAGGPNRLNATIKDRFFNAAASNPATVFPNLIRLAQHHISKSDYGDFRDRELAEILSSVASFPIHLNIQQQGLFILGYYHQKQDSIDKIKVASDAKKEAAATIE